MTEADTPVIPYTTPADPAPPITSQPWWLGSLLCIFVAATSHFGLLELFGNTAYITTFALLALGIYLAILGIWKRRDQLSLALAALGLNMVCVGVVMWLLIRKA